MPTAFVPRAATNAELEVVSINTEAVKDLTCASQLTAKFTFLVVRP